MQDSSNSSFVPTLSGLVLILLFGGVGIYLVNERQQMRAAEATEAAKAQDMKARLVAEENRAGSETEDEIRIISMREAETDEQILFFSHL